MGFNSGFKGLSTNRTKIETRSWVGVGYIYMYIYLIYMIENSITHNLMSRGLDTQGYTILRNVFKHEQDKNRKKPGRG